MLSSFFTAYLSNPLKLVKHPCISNSCRRYIDMSEKDYRFVVLLAFFMLGIFHGCGNTAHCAENDSGLINIAPNSKLPSFKLPDFKTRKPLTLKTDSGKPTIITFFSLIPPYREKRSLNLLEIQAKLDNQFDDKINSAAIFSDDQNSAALHRYIDDGLIKVKIWDDSARKLYNKYGIYMMPISVLLNSEGNLHAVIPYTEELKELITTNIRYLLGDLTKNQLKSSLQPKANITLSKEEKEYVRRVNYGRVMLARKMYPAAIREFSTAAKIMPDSIEALIGLGNVQLKAKKIKKAELYFNKALTINKDSDEALSGLGTCLYRQGKLKEALPILESAFIAEKPSLNVIVALADIYEQKGDIKKAVRLNKLAISRLISQD